MTSHVQAQGLIPPKPKAKETVTEKKYTLVSERIPDNLKVIDAAGVVRPLFSYKTVIDVLVIGFYSPSCDTNRDLWKDLKRFYEAYKDWPVSFLAIDVRPDGRLSDLVDAMSKAGLNYPAVRDERQQVATALHATATPEIMIIDESGYLRYRGPLHDAVQTPGKRPKKHYANEALEAAIGKVENIREPEPGGFIGCPIQ